MASKKSPSNKTAILNQLRDGKRCATLTGSQCKMVENITFVEKMTGTKRACDAITGPFSGEVTCRDRLIVL